ncbi:MAG: glycosyltransferase [Deltaproteobacteria bacterium]|nr:glycosyltransferase [Deltaproteobacteria bacterium]
MSCSSDQAPRPIAFFSPELVRGGTQRHLLEVLRLIDRARFAPIVICAKGHGPLGDEVRAAEVPLVELGLGPSMASRDVLRCVREAAAALRAHRVRLVQYFEWRAGLIALLAARRVGGCRIVAARRSVNKERGVQRWLADVVVLAADRIVVNAALLRPRGRAGERTDVIPSGVDTGRFRPDADRAGAKARLGLDPTTPVIGTVGRLEPRKGTATLIAAVAALRDTGRAFSAVVVGDGPLRRELEADVAARALGSRIRLLGDRTDVRGVLAALDAFVLPSRTEGMSNALLEAMAMGLPAIATAVGGNPEVIADGRSGLLVPAEDPGAMAAAVGRVLDDGALAVRLGAAARRAVEERYGARSMVRRLEAVYAAVGEGGARVANGRAALVAAPGIEGAELR